MLSILSFRRGARTVAVEDASGLGNPGVLGRLGLNVAIEGGRVARKGFPFIWDDGFVGDTGRMVLAGRRGLAGDGEGGGRPIVRDCI